MLTNYFKIAIRNISRHKGYTFLNVAGLAIGIAACMIISFYIKNELSYDTFHKDADQVYRVALDIQNRADHRVFAKTSAPLASTLTKDFPQVESSVRLWLQNDKLVKYGNDRRFYEDNFIVADPAIFKVFTIPLYKGNWQTALNQPYTVVISQEIASKYFKNEEPIGKVLNINDRSFLVTGVIEKQVYSSHFTFNIITAWESFKNADWYKQGGVEENWFSTMFYTYIKVKKNTNIPALEKRIASASDPYVGQQLKEWGMDFNYFLQPLKSIHLNSHLQDEAQPGGNAVNVYIFSVVAFLIILIASLNYINLSTAQAANRAKEVGVRKAIGASKTPLLTQFIGESLLVTTIAFVFGLLIVFISRPLFESLSGQTFNFQLIFSPQFVLVLLALVFLVGVLAAIYPAMFLSSFRPSSVLRGTLSIGSKGKTLRQFLVVCQFAISLMLIVGTVMVYRQLNFMKNQDLGFNGDQVIVLPIRGGTSIADRYEEIKDEFQKSPAVLNAATSSSVPGKDVANYNISLLGEENDKSQSMYYLFTDFDFLNTYKIEMVAGSQFEKNKKSKAESSFLINEKGVKAFGWSKPEEALGKKIQTGFGKQGEIIGVYKDFHYRSLHLPVDPLVMAIQPWTLKNISLRISTQDLPTTIDFIEKKWKALFPDSPFEYSFLDEQFNQQYKADEKTGRTFLVFTCIAIFIACLGLFGLATYVAQQRTQEIGIRKVLGASIGSIVSLLSKDFAKLVVIAFFVSVPISYFLIHKWLQNFATRIPVGWETFFISGLVILLIAMITVSFQSVKAAVANPVKSLKTQ